MGGISPLGALGAVASGYVEQANNQRKMAIEEGYKDSLIAHNKAEAKYKESQIQLAFQKQQFQDQLMEEFKRAGGFGGFGAPPPAGAVPGQPQPQMGMRPMSGGPMQVPADKQQVAQLITQEAIRQGVDPQLALRIAKQESGFQMVPGGSGEQGYFQLMPATAQEMGVNPNDPNQNIQGGVGYIRKMLDTFGGDITKAIAAYNAGPGNIQRRGIINPQYVNAIGYQGSGYLPQQIAQGQTQSQLGLSPVSTDQPSLQGTTGYQPQAPTKGDISQMPYNKRLLMDMMMHQAFDKFDPKLREASPEFKYLDLGTHYQAVDKQGRIMGTIPKTPEYRTIKSVDPATGREYETFYNPYKPMGTAGMQPGGIPTTTGPGGEQKIVPGFLTKLGPKEMAPKIPEAIEQKISSELDPVLKQLDYLQQTSDPRYFGAVAQIASKGLENSVLQGGVKTLNNMGLINIGDPEKFLDWYKTLWRLQNKEIHEFAGATMTYNEMNRVIKQLANSNSQEAFNAGANATRRATQAYKQSVYDFYSKPEVERAGEAMKGGSKPSLELGRQPSGLPQGAKPTGRTSGGRPVYQLPDGNYWVQ